MESILVGPKSRKEEKPKYPYLGINTQSGRVILFARPGEGTVLHEVIKYHSIGKHGTSWSESDFEPLEGKIVLRN